MILFAFVTKYLSPCAFSVNIGVLPAVTKETALETCSAIQGSTGGLEGKETKWV